MKLRIPYIQNTGKTAIRFLFILCCMLLLPKEEVKATHIVGGHLTYRCLGGNLYEIKLSLRRDCLLGASDAQFDDPASIGFFDATTNLPLAFVGFGGELFMDLRADDTLNQIFVSDCSIAGNPVCVHQTTYVDTIFLPFWANGYKMVYQRCCRNGSVQNILNPLLTGMSLVSEMSAAAQAICKSSPQIGAYPPIYICVNKAIDYKLPATDLLGDSLSFSLATPFSGGDIINNMPQPPFPPPYALINWRPPYSLANVMGGIPLAINPATGQITGTPNTVGQFVITIVISAFRNGVELTQTRVDFQYNVRDCHDVPIADFSAQELNCDDLNVNFTNTSTNADHFHWIFDYGNPDSDTSLLENPNYTYEQEGFYDVALIVHDSNAICFDTIVKTVGVFTSLLNAEFTYSSTSCSDSIVLNVTDLSTDPEHPIVGWEWLLTYPGGVIPDTVQNPTFTFDIDDPSTVFLVLIVTDINGCTSSIAKSFQVREINLELNPDADSICNGESVHLLLNGDPDLTYTWSPPNGLDLNQPWDPIAFPGVTVDPYYVTVTDGVCTLIDSITVNVQQLPNLCFEYETACNNLTVDFTNCSTNAINYHWDFGDTSVTDDTSNLANPTYTYNQQGIYIVTLSSRDGCDVFITDTVTSNIVGDSLDGQTINCFQTSIELNPDGNTEFIYQWSPAEFLTPDANSPNPFATVTEDTWFFVTITDPAFPDCPFEDSILVIIPDDFDIEIDGDDITSCDFKEILLTATVTGNTNVEVVWKDLEGNPLGTGLEITVIPQVTTSYVIMATDTLGCMKSDTITIFKSDPTFSVVATNDSTYCYITNITLTAVSIAGVTFEWFNENNELIGTGNTIEDDPEIYTCYYVIGTDLLGCQAADTVCLSPIYFDIEISTEDEIFCDDGEAVLNVTPIDGVTYEWFDPENVLVDTALSIIVSPDVLTCYHVVGTDSLGCHDSDTTCVNPIYFNLTITGDEGICIEDNTTISVIDNSQPPQTLTYIWAPGGETTSSITVSPTDETTYIVTVTNTDLGCKDTLSFTVDVFSFNPAIEITADPPAPFLGQSSQLTVNQNPNFGYVWSATTGENVPPVFNPIVTPTGTSTYCVTVTDDHGCTGEDCYTFDLPELFCDERDIFVPNAFSPNGDGENDFFRVRTNYALTDIEMRVFNRWGEQVYSTNDLGIPWDGTFNGKDLAPDVYGYFLRVTCPDGGTYFTKGNISLLR